MRGGVRLVPKSIATFGPYSVLAIPNDDVLFLDQEGNLHSAAEAPDVIRHVEDLQWEVTESDSDNVVRVQLVLDGIRVRAEFRRPLTRQAFQIKLAEVRRDLLQQAEGLRRSRVLAGTTSTGREAALPPSDPGYSGAIPLAAPTWQPVPFLSDAEWADQNRKINDLLMRGKEP